jgi:EmrB/QacA subfamily drug resistance transporter
MSTQFQVPQSKAEADPRRWIAMSILLIASFMNLIDVTIVNVALPSLQEGLGATPEQIEWVIAAYVLAFALGLLPFGRLGDIVGRTRMFLIGVTLFTIASAFCGLAPSIEWLIAARVLQGIAGAVMTPQVLAIATVTFPPEERGLAFSLFGLSAGLAAVCGPIIGGLLIGADLWGLDWRPIFLVNVPVGIVALIAGWFLIRRTPGHPDLKNDYVGIALFGIAAFMIVFPLVEGRAMGWPLWIWAMMASSVVFAGLFAFWESRRHAANQSQLLNWTLINNRNFLLGVLVVTIFSSGIPGFFMVVSLLLQGGFGFTPLESGLTNTPFSVGVLVASIIGGRLASNFLRTRLAIGAAFLVGGMLYLQYVVAGVTDTIDHWWFLAPMFVSGVGLGLGFSSLFQSVLAGVPPRDAGAGSGSLQAFQQVGGAVGVALVGQIFFSTLTNSFTTQHTPHEAFVAASTSAMWYQIASFALVILLVPFLKRMGPRAGAPVTAPIPVEA